MKRRKEQKRTSSPHYQYKTTMFEGCRSFVSVGCLLWNQHKKGKEKKKKSKESCKKGKTNRKKVKKREKG